MAQAPVPGQFGVAHRGSRILWPENTMTAFAGAVDLGFEWLETDLHLTADGVVVCLHDDTLDRTTERSGLIWTVDSSELDTIDAGHRHGADQGYPYRGAATRIPRLEELVTSFPGAAFVVDLKQDGLAGPLWRIVERYRLHDRVIVGSFSDRRLAEFRAISRGSVALSTGPYRSMAALGGAMVGRAPRLAQAVQFPDALGRFRPLTPRTVRAFRRSGYRVHVWTVNEPEAMHRFYDMGVEAVITDRPDLLREVLVERGSWRA